MSAVENYFIEYKILWRGRISAYDWKPMILNHGWQNEDIVYWQDIGDSIKSTEDHWKAKMQCFKILEELGLV